MTRQKQVKIDGQLGAHLARWCAERGVKQQHILSMGTFFVMRLEEKERIELAADYRRWLKQQERAGAPGAVS
jgi:hypothetical protein